MNKTFLYTLVVSTTLLFGCEKYLDEEPDNRTQINSPEQVAQLLTNAYPKATYILFAEAMSDNAEDKGGGSAGIDFTDKINRQSYRYEVVEVAPTDLDGPDFYWNACYKAIAQANLALEIISQSADSASLLPHKGEALLARAYAHFMLVTFFAKAYDPATAASDPGIPYVKKREKEIFAQYERGTVAAVYENIENDLKQGYPLIDDRIYKEAPRFHFNKRAAAAFAARFYLFKKEYNNVVTYANQALTSNPAEDLRPWNTTLTNMQYLELEAEYTKSTLKGNLLLQEANSVWGRSYSNLRFGLGQNIANQLLFTSNVSGWLYAYDVYGANPQVYNIPKFYEHFVRESINANSGEPYNTIPLLTAEEALLNRAEAFVRLNNNASAINDMNAFLSKNIRDYDPATDNVSTSKVAAYYNQPTSTAMVSAILDFKRAFFLHEGLRWLDILRLKIPVVHTTIEGETIELGPEDKRRILQLPALTKQAGLQPNDR